MSGLVRFATMQRAIRSVARHPLARTACLMAGLSMLFPARDLCAAEAKTGPSPILENAAIRVSIDPQTAAWEVRDKRNDQLWRQSPDETVQGRVKVQSVRSRPTPDEGVEAHITYLTDGKQQLPMVLRWRLVADAAELSFEVSGDAQGPMPEVPLPAPFVLDAAQGAMVVSHQAGLLFGVEEVQWHGRKFMLSMPWFGAQDLATGQGYMAILETPDDMELRGCKVRGDQREVLSMQVVLLAQKGKFGAARRLRYRFFDQGGYVAMAKHYRSYARDKGLLKTLTEKRQERPNIDRLVGAVNIYGNDFQNIEELRRQGIERALVSGFVKDQVRQMNAWGYLSSHYDIYTDLYEPGTRPSKWERCEGFRFPKDVIKKPDGSNLIGWCPVLDPETGKKDPSYVICWTCGLRTLRQKMPHRLAESPFSAYFLDCVTATALRECYDPNHPLTRSEDRETRVKQFAYLSQELGLVVGSEEGRDWAAAAADYFEGVMGTGTWLAFNKQLHAIPFEPFVPTERYQDLTLNPARRVPLFQLVYGDCVETTWRWGDSNHRMLDFWDQKDLLNIVHASMPTWILWRPQQDLFWNNIDRFLECYNHVCRWRRAVGYAEMTNHERLTKDGLVHKSSFANGASVTVNFARQPHTLADGSQIPSRSFLIQGAPAQLSGLPVGRPIQVREDWKPRPNDPSQAAGFERGPGTWRAAKGMRLEIQDAIVHGGQRAARLSGTQTGGWSYAAAGKVPLQPGQKYLIRGWLRVDALEDAKNPSQNHPRQDARPSGSQSPADSGTNAKYAPLIKCGISQGSRHLSNALTKAYDMTKLGTWQQLEGTFVAPQEADAGSLAVEKRTTEPLTATLYLDEVELLPTGTTP